MSSFIHSNKNNKGEKYTLNFTVDERSSDNYRNSNSTLYIKQSFNHHLEKNSNTENIIDFTISTKVPIKGLKEELLNLQKYFANVSDANGINPPIMFEDLTNDPFDYVNHSRKYDCSDKPFRTNPNITPLAKLFVSILYKDFRRMPIEEIKRFQKMSIEYKNNFESLLKSGASINSIKKASNIRLQYLFEILGVPITQNSIELIQAIDTNYITMDSYNVEALKLQALKIKIFSFILDDFGDDETLFKDYKNKLLTGDLLITRESQAYSINNNTLGKISNGEEKIFRDYQNIFRNFNNLNKLNVNAQALENQLNDLSKWQLRLFVNRLVKNISNQEDLKEYITTYTNSDNNVLLNSYTLYKYFSEKFMAVMETFDHQDLHSTLFKRNFENSEVTFLKALLEDEKLEVTNQNLRDIKAIIFNTQVGNGWSRDKSYSGKILLRLSEVMSPFEVFKLLTHVSTTASAVEHSLLNYEYWDKYCNNYHEYNYSEMPYDWGLELTLNC